MPIRQNTPAGAPDNYTEPRQPIFNDLLDFSILYRAFKAAFKGKGCRARYFRFAIDFKSEINNLLHELRDGTYRPETPRTFTIWCISGQKQRVISAPCVKDLILQHAVYDLIYQHVDRHFIFDSYGCRKGGGTHKAADRLQTFIRKCAPDSYYLQLDFRKFYYSIDHAKLSEALHHFLRDERLIDLILSWLPPDQDKGLYVGAMISQLMGLVYLDKLDHYLKRVLKVKYYIRYVDDLVILGLTRQECEQLLVHIQAYADSELHLTFSKIILQPIKHGINFVGFRTWQNRRLVRKRSLHNFNRKLKQRKFLSIQALYAHALKTATKSHFLNQIKTFLQPQDFLNFHGVLRHDLLQQADCHARP